MLREPQPIGLPVLVPTRLKLVSFHGCLMGGREPKEELEDNGYDNPVVASLERDLDAVLRRTDARMFIFIAIGLVASHLPDYVKMPPVAASALYAITVVALVGGIAFTIYSSVKGKRKVADRYGVACGACGYRPKINDIVHRADMGSCPRCGAELRVRPGRTSK